MGIMSKHNAAYLAGLIDGEGTLDFGVNKRFYKKDQTKKIYYQPRIRISLVDKHLLEWIAESYGGWLETRPGRKANHNTVYTWSISGRQMVPFLQAIKPYLKLKQEQAEILLRKAKLSQLWIDQQVKQNGSFKTHRPEIDRESDEMYQRLKELNKRGK